jgi:phosphoglycolate phosphatase-like HAD superfamily hydrolase
MIYIFDIDGTLADLTHRLHFIQSNPKDWDGFFAACENDLPIPEVVLTLALLYKAGAGILLISGRSETIRDKTQSWLIKHGIPFNGLYMRRAGDHREDNIVKAELLDQLIKERPFDEINSVFEDRDQVVKMYRDRGLRVFQVAPGAF